MSGGTVTTGLRTWNGAITSTGTAEEVVFADRYSYFQIVNLGGDILYVTSDGTTPVTSGASNTQAIAPGQAGLIANELPLWYQSSDAIPEGALTYPTGGQGTTTTPNGQPGGVTQQRSLAGEGSTPGTNPGAKITLVGTTAQAYLVAAAG